MKKINFYFATILAKMSAFGLKFMKKSAGTSFPGVIALKLCPKYLKYAQKYCNKKIINITGTNGKTTTSGYLSSILKEENSIINNKLGANMLQGIVSSIALQIKPFKKYDYFVLETDEAFLTKVYDNLKGDFLLVTNLFRDQLDRYGELDTTKKFINDAISKNKNLQLLINADDPMLMNFCDENKKYFYGFEQIIFEYDDKKVKNATQNVTCPKCGANLEYEKRYYAHVGKYFCKCGFKRPELDFGAKVTLGETTKIEVSGLCFTIFQNGLYNAYNALGAICIALLLGIKPSSIQKSFDNYETVFGRNEKIEIEGKKVLINLIKNPVGASEVLKNVHLYKNPNVMIALNDNHADGRDVSWIFDTDFETLSNVQNEIMLSGSRALDLAVRLKYAPISEKNMIIENNLKNAFFKALEKTPKDGILMIFPTYTALLEMQKFIKK